MESTIVSDQLLVEQYLAGDKSAFETLLNRHKSRVFSYILMLVKNRAFAEDIFQDTFTKVLRSLQNAGYKEDGRFLPWVLRIAHNLVIDYFRKQRNYREVSNEQGDFDLFDNIAFSERSNEDSIVKKQILQDVRELIRLLPEEQRTLVIMRLYMDMSFKEIAEETGVSINTALGRMRYAIVNLRKLMSERGLVLEMN